MEKLLDFLVFEMEQNDDSLDSPNYSPTSPNFGSPDCPDSPQEGPQDLPAPKKVHIEEERHWQSSATRFPIKMREEMERGLDPNTNWEEREVMEVPMYGGCCIMQDIYFDEAWVHRNTPLHNAVWFRDFQLVEFLLAAGADPNLHNALGYTPLHEAILNYYDPKPDDIPFWIKHGADLDATTLEAHVRWGWEGERSNVGGYTPLISTMITGQISAMKLLLKHGANPNWKSPDGWKILDLALLADDRRAMGLLISSGAEFSVSPTNVSASLRDKKNDARELLAVATSNRVFPPQELQEIYHYALSQTVGLQQKEGLSDDTSQKQAEKIIDQFYSSLRTMAEMTRDLTPESFCRQCSDFQAQVEFYYEGYPADRKELEFQLFDNQTQLDTSAMNGCPLCSIVADVLDAGKEKPETTETDEKATITLEDCDDPITLKTSFFVAGFYKLASMYVFRRGERKGYAELLSVDEQSKPIIRIKQNKVSGEGFDDAMNTAKDWLKNCKSSQSHLPCQKFSQEVQANIKRAYPARLVAVGDEQSSPFLVESVDDSIPYAALSYPRASNEITVRTLNTNLKERKQSIPIINLPELFQDAITTTRKLGFNYIWIDELCIIQDNEEDRQNEISKMDWIYLGAEITISGLVAESISDRLMPPRSFRSTLPVPIKMWRTKGSRPDWKAGEVKTTVLSRPWLGIKDGKLERPANPPACSVQEELLGSRVLYFGRESVYWTCPCIQLAEANPTKPIQHRNAQRGDLWKHILVKRAMRGISADPKDPGYDHEHPELISSWKDQIEAYSNLKLVHPEDRLPGIWGLSRFMATRCQNEFVGGIWWGDKLAESLSWRPKTPLPGEIRSPSWSWVSITGEVSYDQVDKDCRQAGSIALAAPVSHQIRNHPTSSNLSGSTITIKGSLYSKQILEKYENNNRSFNFYAEYAFDYEDYGPGWKNLYVFDLLGFEQGPPPTGWGLPAYPNGRSPGKLFMLLDSTGLSPGQFRRVGLGILQMFERYRTPVSDMWISDEIGFKDTITLV